MRPPSGGQHAGQLSGAWPARQLMQLQISQVRHAFDDTHVVHVRSSRITLYDLLQPCRWLFHQAHHPLGLLIGTMQHGSHCAEHCHAANCKGVWSLAGTTGEMFSRPYTVPQHCSHAPAFALQPGLFLCCHAGNHLLSLPLGIYWWVLLHLCALQSPASGLDVVS